jgi:hypothetical protein
MCPPCAAHAQGASPTIADVMGHYRKLPPQFLRRLCDEPPPSLVATDPSTPSLLVGRHVSPTRTGSRARRPPLARRGRAACRRPPARPGDHQACCTGRRQTCRRIASWIIRAAPRKATGRMEEDNRYGALTEDRRFAMTRLCVGTVIWGDTEPGWNRMPVPYPDSAVEYRCHIDTGADWCSVTTEAAGELDLIEFDAPPPTTLAHPREGLVPRRGACITVVVGSQVIVAPAYIGLPPLPNQDEQRHVLIGTWVLRHLRFTYDGPDRTYSLGPF